MRFNKEFAYESYERDAIKKTGDLLKKQGFIVYYEYSFELEDNTVRIDIFAEKDSDRRIYEFKVSDNKIQKAQYNRLQTIAKALNAKLYIVYLEKPKSAKIEFEGLNDILRNDINRKPSNAFGEDQINLRIKGIEGLVISSIIVKKTIVRVEGTSIALISDESEIVEELNDYLESEFKFRITYDLAKEKVNHSYYKFDKGIEKA